MQKYFFDQDGEGLSSAEEGDVCASNVSEIDGYPEAFACSAVQQIQQTPDIPFSVHLSMHSLSFSWNLGETKRLMVHLHKHSIEECTSICKELIFCTMMAHKILKKRADKSLGIVCSQCGIAETPLWRKINAMIVCNACGLYSRTHNGMFRPSRLFKENEDQNRSDKSQ
ncbi:hypothetical protein NECID01_1909 [Nematocida sp. AWRm77]|nr:hypothetical protein NECID01_1909 [Nematocida sp. AWRm77]